MTTRVDAIRFFKNNPLVFFKKQCKVVSKSGELLNFIPNETQLIIHSEAEKQKSKTGKVRLIILKGRQQGCTTYIRMRFLHKITHTIGHKALVMVHLHDAGKNLFSQIRQCYDAIDWRFKPEFTKNNESVLAFDTIQSQFSFSTAGSKGTGRSATLQLFHGCVSFDSKIILSNGESVSMENIKIGDLVCTSSGDFAPVKNKIFTGEKKVFEIKTFLSNEFIEISKDHKVLTQRGWVKCEDLTIKDYIKTPKIKIKEKLFKKCFELKNIERPQGGGTKHIEKSNITLDYNCGYFFGYYLAEGHVKKQNKSINNRFCNVSFCYHEKEDFIKNIKLFAEKYGCSFSEKHILKNHKKIFTIYGSFLAELTNAWFGRVDSKHIPEWVFDCDKEFIKGLIIGYFDGDGSKNEINRIRATSIHEKISRQIKRLITSITDSPCALKYYTDKYRYDVKTKDVFVVEANRESFDFLNSHKQEKYKNLKYIKIENQLFVKIKSLCEKGVKRTFDIEIDHKDHDFETPIGIVSNSEVAFWDNASEHTRGMMQALSSQDGSECFLESTANGMTGDAEEFYNKFMTGLDKSSDFKSLFIPWFTNAEYQTTLPNDFTLKTHESWCEKEYKAIYGLTDTQVYWARQKIATDFNKRYDMFCIEYPANPHEAFEGTGEDSFIEPRIVIEARKRTPSGHGDVILGVDVGGDEFGKSPDRSVIALRKGDDFKIIFQKKGISRDDLMQKICDLIKEFQPQKTFIDITGIGYNLDRDLVHLCNVRNVSVSQVTGVNFGSNAIDSVQFTDCKAEMYYHLREALIVGSCDDSAELQKDLLATGYERDKMRRLKMQSKKNLTQSPDLADAMALCCYQQPLFYSGVF